MLGHVVILFNFLRSHQTVLHSSCTILQFHPHPSSSNSPVFANTCYSPLIIIIIASSVQFSSVAQSCPTLCDPMNCSTPGRPVHHQLISIMSIVKLISIESVMPSSHLILCRPLLLLPQSLPALEYFPKRQLFA